MAEMICKGGKASFGHRGKGRRCVSHCIKNANLSFHTGMVDNSRQKMSVSQQAVIADSTKIRYIMYIIL